MDGVKKKIADLNQQIAVNLKRKNKAYKYIKKIHENTPHKGNKLYNQRVMASAVFV